MVKIMLKKKYYSNFRKSDNTAIIKCLVIDTDTRQVTQMITAETSLETPNETIKTTIDLNLDFDAVREILRIGGYTFIGE